MSKNSKFFCEFIFIFLSSITLLQIHLPNYHLQMPFKIRLIKIKSDTYPLRIIIRVDWPVRRMVKAVHEKIRGEFMPITRVFTLKWRQTFRRHSAVDWTYLWRTVLWPQWYLCRFLLSIFFWNLWCRRFDWLDHFSVSRNYK